MSENKIIGNGIIGPLVTHTQPNIGKLAFQIVGDGLSPSGESPNGFYYGPLNILGVVTYQNAMQTWRIFKSGGGSGIYNLANVADNAVYWRHANSPLGTYVAFGGSGTPVGSLV